MRQLHYIIFASIFGMLFLGCSLQTTVPASAKYMLKVKAQAKTATSSCYKNEVIRMAEVESSAMFSGRSIFYSSDDTQSYSYTKARWMESINKQFATLIMRSVTQTEIFKDVVPFRSRAKNELIFETGIYDFSQVIHKDGTSTVSLMVKVRIVEQYSRKIISNKTFTFTKSGLSGNIEGALNGYNTVVSELLKAINQWLLESCHIHEH